jgi:hypothetical protein
MVEEQLRGFARVANHPRSRKIHLPDAQVRALLRAYLAPLALSPAQVSLLDYFVHDSLANSPMDLAAQAAGNNGYFKLRGIDTSDELPDALQAQTHPDQTANEALA